MRSRRRSLTVLIAAVMPWVAQRAYAQNTTWIGGTDWNTAANWSNGVPNSSAAVANFTGGGTGTISVSSSSIEASTLNFSASNVAYDLSGDATLQDIYSINLSSNVAVVDEIDLLGAKDGLEIPDNATLLLSNNSTAGGMLLISSRTYIGDYSFFNDGHNVYVSGPGTTQFNGIFDQVYNGLTKRGPGTFYFTGAGEESAGPLTLNGGQVIIDYSVIRDTISITSAALTLQNGDLTLTTNSHAPVIQSFLGATTAVAAHTSIQASGSGQITLAAGNIVRQSAGTLDFVLSSDPNFRVTTTTANNSTGGLLGSGSAYATVNGGTTWAFASAGAITAYTNYGTNTFTSGTNTDVTVSGSPAAFTTNTLRFNAPNVSLTLTGSNTLQAGGILVTPSGGGDQIAGSATLAAPSGGEIIVHQYSTGSFTIATALSSSTGLTKTGPGTLTLSGNNTGLTGPINISRGSLTITGLSAVNSASAINFNDARAGSSLQTFTMNLPSGTSGTINPPILVTAFSASGSATVISTGSTLNSIITFGGVISSAPSLYNPTPASIRFTGEPGNSNTFVLGNANTFLGDVDLAQGSLQISSNNSLGNTANSLTLDTNDAINGGLVYPQAGTFAGGFTIARSVIIASTSRITTKGLATETISGPVSGAGAIVKAAVGTLSLTGTDTFGGLQVTNGAVSFTSGGSLTTAGNIFVGNSSTAGQNGVLNIDGASSVVQTGSSFVQVGSSSGGTNGTISVGTSAAGSIFTVGSGGITIATSGSSVNVGTSAVPATMNSSGNVLVNAGTLMVNAGSMLNLSGGALVVQAGATFTNSGTVNLTDGDMIVNYSGNNSPVNSIRSSLTSAFDGGAWDGPGITSSVAAVDTSFRTGMGYAEASQLGIANGGRFDGQTIAGQAVVVKYTYYGDNDLDGKVTLNDFSIFVDGFNGLGSGWVYGDYDYNGVVDMNDFAMFADAYKNQGSQLSLRNAVLSDSELSLAQKQAMLNVVPEPTAALLLPIALLFTKRRRG